jgi:hypothetical protein
VRAFSDLMMADYLKVIQKTLSHPDPSTSYVHEDALMAIGSLANGTSSLNQSINQSNPIQSNHFETIL